MEKVTVVVIGRTFVERVRENLQLSDTAWTVRSCSILKPLPTDADMVNQVAAPPCAERLKKIAHVVLGPSTLNERQ
jgi:hypothetical protein